MKTALFIITALIVCLFSCPNAMGKEKQAEKTDKPILVTSIQKIANGRTFQDQNSEKVSFTLRPLKAFLKISF